MYFNPKDFNYEGFYDVAFFLSISIVGLTVKSWVQWNLRPVIFR
jgi:hypothetical protein